MSNIYLMVIAVDPDTEENDFYFLVQDDKENGTYIPLTSEGYILLFQSREMAGKVLAMSDYEGKATAVLPDEIASEIDVSQVAYLLQGQTFDDTNCLVNFYNTFLDMLLATRYELIDEYKLPLWAFANHMTMNKEFGQFFEESGFDRRRVTNATLWLIGAVFSNIKIIR